MPIVAHVLSPETLCRSTYAVGPYGYFMYVILLVMFARDRVKDITFQLWLNAGPRWPSSQPQFHHLTRFLFVCV